MNTLEEAKQAVRDGHTVIYKGSPAYVLRHNVADNQWYIVYLFNDSCASLYYRDGVRTDYKGSDFSIKE